MTLTATVPACATRTRSPALAESPLTTVSKSNHGLQTRSAGASFAVTPRPLTWLASPARRRRRRRPGQENRALPENSTSSANQLAISPQIAAGSMNPGHAYRGVDMLEAQRRRSLTGARTVAISASRKIPEKRFCPRVRCRAVADAGSIGGVAGTHALAQTPAGSIGIAG